VRAALATAAMTALLASGAYAAANSDFFESAFGPEGKESIPADSVVLYEKEDPNTGDTVVSYFPESMWVDVDLEVAERLLGAYVEEVGRSIEVNGYTLLVENCVVDENGLGVATIVVSNPNGVSQSDHGGGLVSIGDATTGFELGTSADRYSHREFRDAARSTETELYATVYFGPFAGETGEGGVSWWLANRLAQNEQKATYYEDVSPSIVHKPESAAPVTVLTSEAGGSVEISPLGLMAYAHAEPDQHDPMNPAPGISNSLSTGTVTVHYADGTEYIVVRYGMEGSVHNVGTSFQLFDQTATGFLFNRLVDVDAVESVTVQWRGYVNDEPYEAEHVYTR